jgi:hypothetical protein
MIALQLMRTQFPKLDKVFYVPWKYNFQSSRIFYQQKHVSVYCFIFSAIPINFVQYMECCWCVCGECLVVLEHTISSELVGKTDLPVTILA